MFDGLKGNVNDTRSFANSMTRWLFGDKIADESFTAKPVDGAALQAGTGPSLAQLLAAIDQRLSVTSPTVQTGVGQQLAIQNSQFPGKQKDDFDMGRKVVSIDGASIAAMVAPSGVQQVHVTNSMVPNVSVSAPITVNGVMNPEAAESSVASKLGAAVKNAVSATHTD